jgi:YesN/AraC family two-component response regulator
LNVPENPVTLKGYKMPYKILIIDDEKPTLSMFRLLLTALGYDVLTAENAVAGLELLKSDRPEIILTDIKMPGMNGLALLEKIEQENPATKIIVMTGHGDMNLEQAALDLNATAFLHKPIDKTALEAALEKAKHHIADKR